MESALQREYFCRLENVGAEDLSEFRDAVLTYAQALRNKRPFYCQATVEAGVLLKWLGVEWNTPQQAANFEVQGISGLPDGSGLPEVSLEVYRAQGYLGRTLFAALIRSSYGPDEDGYFPTASELGFYFDPALLRREIRWDQDYLDECQRFFFEELTPAELLAHTLELMPTEAGLAAQPFSEELQGVLFLVGEGEWGLRPLNLLLQGILVETAGSEVLHKLWDGAEQWTEEEVGQAWERLSEAERERVVDSVLGGQSELAVEILTACGQPLIDWRRKR